MTMAPGMQPIQPTTIDPAILQQLGLAQPPQDSLTLLQHILPMLPPQLIPYITALMQHPEEFSQMNPSLAPTPTAGLLSPVSGQTTDPTQLAPGIQNPYVAPTAPPPGGMAPKPVVPAPGMLPPTPINGDAAGTPDVMASGAKRETIGLNIDPRYNVVPGQEQASTTPAGQPGTPAAPGTPATPGTPAAKAALASPTFNSALGGMNVPQPGGAVRTEGTTPDQQSALVKAALAPGISYGVGNLKGYDPTTGAPINDPNAPQGHLGGNTPAPANEDPAFQRFRNDYANSVMQGTISSDQAAAGPKAVGPGGIPIY